MICKEKAKVAILMSTYNGEQYVLEQLESIQNQVDVKLDIYIRDDFSTDTTYEQLKKYCISHENVQLYRDNNVGVGNSFMQLLYYVPDFYDYYAFSDQDDIWEKDKIIQAIECLVNNNAILYGSNQRCVDSEENFLEYRYNKDERINLSPESILERNMIAGCTMVFTRELYLILNKHRPTPDLLHNRIHDVWVAMVASLCGKIYYDNRAFMNYRQHEKNLVGAYDYGIICDIKRKIKKIFCVAERNGRSRLAEEIVYYFPLESQKHDCLKMAANSKTVNGKLLLLKNRYKFIIYTGETQLGFMLKVLLGVF